MSRKCQITGKKTMVGNNVSHSNRKNKTRFLPNLHKIYFTSEILGQKIALRVTTNGLRTVEYHGGIDKYLISTPITRLAPDVVIFKKQITRILKSQTAA